MKNYLLILRTHTHARARARACTHTQNKVALFKKENSFSFILII